MCDEPPWVTQIKLLMSDKRWMLKNGRFYFDRHDWIFFAILPHVLLLRWNWVLSPRSAWAGVHKHQELNKNIKITPTRQPVLIVLFWILGSNEPNRMLMSVQDPNMSWEWVPSTLLCSSKLLCHKVFSLRISFQRSAVTHFWHVRLGYGLCWQQWKSRNVII